MKKGIDVSYAQGKIDWCKVKTEIDFAIIRGGYYTTRDKYADYNLLNCNAHEIRAGVYWFSYAFTPAEAKLEARKTLELCQNYRIEYPIIFDYEYDSIYYAQRQGIKIKPIDVINMATAYCNEIEKAGYYAMIYSNLDFYRNWFGAEIFKRFGLWLANPSRITNNTPLQMEQVSWTGKFNGISGNVDVNHDYVNLGERIKKANLNHL